MAKTSFPIILIYILTLLFMGGVYSFYWFFIFTILLILWSVKKYYTVFKYKTYREMTINIELPILIFVLYSFLIFIPYLQPSYHNSKIIEEFNELWFNLKITKNKNISYSKYHYFTTIISILMILSSYLWIKIILLYKKYILNSYKYLFLLYNIVILLSFFDIGIYGLLNNSNKEVMGFFINIDHLSTFLSVPLPIIIFYLFKKNKNEKREDEKTTKFIIKVLYLILVLSIIVLLLRRMVLISLIITFFIYFLILINNKSKNKVRIIFSSIILIISINVLIYVFASRLTTSIFSNENINMGNINFRLDAIKNAFSIFKDNWLLGIGGGNFSLVYPFYSQEEHFFMHHLHNEYIQILVEYGILGVSIILWGYFNLFKTIKYGLNKLKSEKKDLFIVHLLAILMFQIQIFSDFQLHIGALLFMFLFFVTMLYIIIDSKK